MSEDKFRQAKGELAFSQSLVDELRQSQMPQEEDMQAPQEEVVENPVEDVVEEPEVESDQSEGLVKTIKDVISPYMEKITDLISKKEEEPKEVEVKIEGEMTPKE